MMTESEELLVKQAQTGDRAAFEELVRRVSRLVFARLYLEVGETHRAEDLLQETLWTAFRGLKSLSEPKNFRAWLLKIAQNAAIDAARRDNRLKRPPSQRRTDNELSTVPDRGTAPNDAACRSELRGRILAVLRSLPEEYRMPLTLRYVGGADYETICVQLGLTNGSLRGLLHRGLQMLRSKIPQEMFDLHS